MTEQEMREIAKAQYAAHRVWRRMNPEGRISSEVLCFPEGARARRMKAQVLEACVRNLNNPARVVKVKVYRGKTGQFNKHAVQEPALLFGWVGAKNAPKDIYEEVKCDVCGRIELGLSSKAWSGGISHSRQGCTGYFLPLRKDGEVSK